LEATGQLSITGFTVGVLAVWRITHLFWAEDGPFDSFVRLRRLAGANFVGKLLGCFYCLSLWAAALPAWLLGATWSERAMVWFALSGGAILLERATGDKSWSPPPAVWHEEPLPLQPSREE